MGLEDLWEGKGGFMGVDEGKSTIAERNGRSVIFRMEKYRKENFLRVVVHVAQLSHL